jgi:hypothetical protein
MRKALYILAVVLCIPVLDSSCTKEDFCINDVVAYLNIGFYTWQNGERMTKTIKKFTANGISSDSLIYNSKSNVKTIALPLSNRSDSSKFIFTFIVEIPAENEEDPPVNQTFTDTIDFIYTRHMYLVSPLCGFAFNYNLLNSYSTHNYIDSVLIVNQHVIINPEEKVENIEILF